MANYQIIPQTFNAAGSLIDSPFKTILGTELKIFIGGTTSTTKIREELISIGNIDFDFRTTGQAEMGEMSLQFSDKSGGFDTNYADIKDQIWFISIDSTEYFRGIADKQNFIFNKTDRTISVRLVLGQVEDKDYTLTTSETGFTGFTTVNLLLVEMMFEAYAISSGDVIFDASNSYTVNTNTTFLLKADAGATDQVVVSDWANDATVNRFPMFLRIFGLDYVIWKGKARIFSKDKFFSETITILTSDIETLASDLWRDYTQDDFFTDLQMSSRRLDDDEFNQAQEKLWFNSIVEKIDTTADKFLPHWKDHSVSGWTVSPNVFSLFAQQEADSGDRWFARFLTLNGSSSNNRNQMVATLETPVIAIGDRLKGSITYLNYPTQTGKIYIQFGAGRIDELDTTPISEKQKLGLADVGEIVEFDYVVDDASTNTISISLLMTDLYDGVNIQSIVNTDDGGGTFRSFLTLADPLEGAAVNSIISIYGTDHSDAFNKSINALNAAKTIIEIVTTGSVPENEYGLTQAITVLNPNVTITSIGKSGLNLRVVTAAEHGVAVGDAVEVLQTTNYNDGYIVSAIINSTTYEIGLDIGEATETSGFIINARVFRDIKISDIQVGKVTDDVLELEDYTTEFRVASNHHLKTFKKGTGILSSVFDDELLDRVQAKAIQVYSDRNNTQFIKRAIIRTKLLTVNPYSRIALDGDNYLIDRFSFNMETGETALELIEER